MTKLLKVFLFVLFILLSTYVFPKSPEFPNPPSDFVQSGEPADIETPLRRGYYTNLSRTEVIAHYEKEFNTPLSGVVAKLSLASFTPRLNYPPEDAPVLIRDQTKSTFLEEIVHPLRESIYINGFEPKTEEYAQFYKGTRYNQKIIVRYVPSSLWIRLFVVTGSILSVHFLLKEYQYAKRTN